MISKQALTLPTYELVIDVKWPGVKESKTYLMPLPPELHVPCGKCTCSTCQKLREANPEYVSCWDTLAFSPDKNHTWIVHNPALQPGREHYFSEFDKSSIKMCGR